MTCEATHKRFIPPEGSSPTFCVLTTFSAPGASEVETLSEQLELLIQDNERWIQSMLRQGIEPPCCSKCGGVKYREPSEADYQAGAILFKAAPDMFRDGVGACGSIAAYDAAALRQLEGVDAWGHIEDSGHGPSSYHAVVGTPAGVHDPTLEMERG